MTARAVPLDRDHPCKRWIAEHPQPGALAQHQCTVCGAWFLLASSFARHRAEEALTLMERAAQQQAAYEARRRDARPRFITREEIARAQG